MNDDNFMILAAVLLGIIQICGTFGFDMVSFLIEPICHSVRERCPDCIIEYAGYYGTSFTDLFYTFGNLIAPCFLPILGAKGALIMSASFFLIFAASFFYLRTWLFFPACMFCGLGFALFYAGGGSYGLRHSTDRTLSRNQSIQCMVNSFTTVLSGIFFIFSTHMANNGKAGILGNGTEVFTAQNQSSYRHYSDTEVRLLSLGMSAFALAALILAILLPKRNLPESLEKKIKNEITLKQQINKVLSAMKQKNLLKLAPFFLFTGSILALLFTIYPTTFAFTDSLVKERNLVAYYCIATCLGEIVVGLIFTTVSKKYHNFGLIPVFILTCIFFVMVMVLTLIYTPAQSSLKPTKELAILEPSAWIGILVGVLYGCLDGSACNARMVAAAKGLPESPAIAFSVAKFYQAGSAMIFLFLGSKMNIHQILYLSGFLMIISIGCYISFLRDLKVSRIGSITEGIEKSGDEKILSE